MIDIAPSNLCRIRIEALEIYGQGQSIEAYIQLSLGKFVCIRNREEENLEMLTRYHKKGVEFVFLPFLDFELFTNSVREQLTQKLKKIDEKKSVEGDISEEKIRALSSAHDIFKAIFNSDKINEESKKLANEIADKTSKLVSQTNVVKYFSLFKKNCSEEFLQVTVVGFIVSAMMDHLAWGKEVTKQKVILASLLCDISLSPDDFKILKKAKGDKDKLTSKIINHPLEIAAKIEKESNLITDDTILIIRQHHERPQGKGFPKGVNHQSITALSAVYIVGHYFVDRMFDENYADEHQEERMANIISQMQEKFSSGVYKKAWEALSQVFLKV